MRAKLLSAAVRLMAVSAATLVLFAFQPGYADAASDTPGDGQQTPAQLPGSGDRPVADQTRGGTRTGTRGTRTGTGTGAAGTPTGTATGTATTTTTATGGAGTLTATATEGDTVDEDVAVQQTAVAGVIAAPLTAEQMAQAELAQQAAVAGQQAPPMAAGQVQGQAGIGLNQLPSTATGAAGQAIAIIAAGLAAAYAALRTRR